jgi:hypothetical protein
MAKHKKFKDWYEEEEDYQKSEKTYKNKDGKRYDKKKSAIQRARRQKARQKSSF